MIQEEQNWENDEFSNTPLKINVSIFGLLRHNFYSGVSLHLIPNLEKQNQDYFPGSMNKCLFIRRSTVEFAPFLGELPQRQFVLFPLFCLYSQMENIKNMIR